MAQTDVSRIQADLDTMKDAMGASSLIPRQTIFAHLGFGLVGFFTAACYFLFPDISTILRAVIFAISVTGIITWVHFKIGKIEKPPAVMHREQKRTLIMLALVIPIQLAIMFWMVKLGVQKDVLIGVGYCLGGISLIAYTGFDKRRLSNLGIAIVLIIFGLIHPFYPGIADLHFVSMMSCALFWTSAAILYFQHRHQPLPDIREM